MAYRVTPLKKDRILLQDLSEDFKDLEGFDCPDDEKAYVSVRQATEADAMEIADLRSERTVQWVPDKSGQVNPQENTDINERLIWCNQAYRALTGAGNIDYPGSTDDSGEVDSWLPVFKFKNHKFNGDFAAFKKAWGLLDDLGVYVILKAVYVVNPQWDWIWSEAEKLGEVYQESSGKSSD